MASDHTYILTRCSKANPDVSDPQMQLLFSLRWRMRDTQTLVVSTSVSEYVRTRKYVSEYHVIVLVIE